MKSIIRKSLFIGLVAISFFDFGYIAHAYFSKENVKDDFKNIKSEKLVVDKKISDEAVIKKEETIPVAKYSIDVELSSQEGQNPSLTVSKNVSSYLISGVPIIQQRPELPTGCEITCVTMMLLYEGFNVDKCELAVEMLYDEKDPSKGFVGDPFKKSGWTIYPSALKGIIRRRTDSFVNLTRCSNSDLEKQIQLNHPVTVWGKFNDFKLHCMLLVGYDSDNYYFNDPWTGRSSWPLDKVTFNQKWEALGKLAVSY